MSLNITFLAFTLIINSYVFADVDLYYEMRRFNTYLSSIECVNVPGVLSVQYLSNAASIIPDSIVKKMFSLKCPRNYSSTVNEFLELNNLFVNEYKPILQSNLKNANLYKQLGYNLSEYLSSNPRDGENDDESRIIPVLPKIYKNCDTVISLSNESIQDYYNRNKFKPKWRRDVWSTIARIFVSASTKEVFKLVSTKLLKKYAFREVAKSAFVKLMVPGKYFALVEFSAIFGSAAYLKQEVLHDCLTPKDYANFCSQVEYYSVKLSEYQNLYKSCVQAVKDYNSDHNSY